MTFFEGLLFYFPILALYYEQMLSSVALIALVFSTRSLSIFIFEVPTGVFGDRYGRRVSIILGQLSTFGSIGLLAIGSPIGIFGYAILNGLGHSFLSGSDTALLYDSLSALGRKKEYKKSASTYFSLWPLGAAIAALIGGVLAGYSLHLPIILSLIPASIAFLLSLCLTEAPVIKEQDWHIFKHMDQAWCIIWKNRMLLFLFLGAMLVHGFGEGVHYLNPLFYAEKGIIIEQFGILVAATFGLSSLGHYFSHALSERLGEVRSLVIFTIATALLFITALAVTGFAAGAIMVSTSIFFGLRNPIVNHITQEHVHDSSRRATVLSLLSFGKNISVVLLVMTVGILADVWALQGAFLVAAFGILLASFAFAKMHRPTR